MPEEISVKIVIIGEPAVGKTTLRKSFVGTEMKGSFLMTLGVDIANSKIQINDNLVLDAQLWDIAGQESWGPITRQFLQGAQGAVIVFDLTRDYTFDKLDEWLKKLHEENPKLGGNIPFLVVGNKADLDGFIKMTDDVVYNYLEFINRHHVYSKTDAEFLRTSAKTGYKVKEAFHRMGEIIVENFRQMEMEDGGSRFKNLLGEVASEKELLDKQFVKVEEELDVDTEPAPRRLTVQEMIAQREAKKAGRDPTKPFHQQAAPVKRPDQTSKPSFTPQSRTQTVPERKPVQRPVFTPPTQRAPEQKPVQRPVFTPPTQRVPEQQQIAKPTFTPQPPAQRDSLQQPNEKLVSAPQPKVRSPVVPRADVSLEPTDTHQPNNEDALDKILSTNVMDDLDETPVVEPKISPFGNNDKKEEASKKLNSLMAPEPKISRKPKSEDENAEN